MKLLHSDLSESALVKSGIVIFRRAALLSFLGLLFLTGCDRPDQISGELGHLKGTTLEGERIDFSSINADRFVINFYSPTCQPCVEELPALNLLNQELVREGVPFYMLVEGNTEAHGLMPVPPSDRDTIYQKLKARLEKDVHRYGMEFPVVILDPEFHVSPQNGFITGTPETLVMTGHPLRPVYNFLGPVASSSKPDEIEEESRYQFALRVALGEGEGRP